MTISYSYSNSTRCLYAQKKHSSSSNNVHALIQSFKDFHCVNIATINESHSRDILNRITGNIKCKQHKCRTLSCSLVWQPYAYFILCVLFSERTIQKSLYTFDKYIFCTGFWIDKTKTVLLWPINLSATPHKEEQFTLALLTLE